MKKLYRLNSLFEFELSDPGLHSTPSNFKKRNFFQEKLFLLSVNPEDTVLLTEPVSEILYNFWTENNLKPAQYILQKEKLNDFHLIEWGKTSYLKNGELKSDPKICESSKYLNSKINQSIWKKEINFQGIMPTIVKDRKIFLPTIAKIGFPLIIKNPLSFAGINHSILSNWQDAEKYLEKSSIPVILEPWKGNTRFCDLSGLFQVHESKVEFLSLTQMQVNPLGQYQSSMIPPNSNPDINFQNIINELTSVVYNIVEKYAQQYNGPLAIDAFLYKENDEIKLQPFSEINFRYSMGRILYDLKKKYGKPESLSMLWFGKLKEPIPNEKEFYSKIFESGNQKGIQAIPLTPVFSQNGKQNSHLAVFLDSPDEESFRKFHTLWNTSSNFTE